ncbi:GntR family transcriptional regulator [Bifidobacterium sp. MA2]|uniref:GntR family transcriptional regulator n=1 Tax=Bifidobacterium santillanense TaxID=2809028 RepID=A0ABS5UPT9_9BIFI|nr:GntR family transcriptional regulator [Bifidobacterium santillanense]MBT1172825.1 GntR family transcriptional regulator [Bifidobacterium santillanense]
MKYRELAKILKMEIERGEYRATGKLPTEPELMERFGVTRYCVRNAIALLVNLGDVCPVQGSGMFVREDDRDGCLNINNTRGLTSEFPGHAVSSKVIKLEQREAGGDAGRLKCDPGDDVYSISRLRLLDGEPFAIEYALYLKEFVPYLNEEIADGSIYSYIRRDLKLVTGFADKLMYARKLDRGQADLLGLSAGDPALVVEDHAYLSNGRLFNVGTVYYHYEKATFFNFADLK